MLVREMYRALELAPGAGTEQIRSAYRRLVKIHHPDLGGSRAGFARIMEAYEGLMRTQQRALPRARPAARTRAPRQRRPPGSRPAAARTAPAPGAGSRTADLFELGSRAMTAADPADRAFACRSLGQTGLKTALAFLRRALLDRSHVVRIAAGRALVQLGTQPAVGALCEHFPGLGEDVQLAILESLAARETVISECYRPAVVDALATQHRGLRRVALGLYARINRSDRDRGDRDRGDRGRSA